jgi:ATP-dependent helicase/nuclease subunit B
LPRRLGKNPEIYNIPAHLSFVDVLAEGIFKRFGADPILLSEVLILLPNRRAVRSLRDAFLRLNDGMSIILPRMQPIGDVDEDELIIGNSILYEELSLKPAVPNFIRQMLLMNIVQSWFKQRGEPVPESAGCATLAESLGNLLDQAQTEELTLDDLENIVPEEHSIHWQQTLDFLKILTENWPNVLSTTGYIDSADRRNRLLSGLRQKWLETPPEFPIIAAGSTGSIKATSELLQVIARLPKGMVVLPGLDINIDDASWEAIEKTHPQATMKQLLNIIQVDRLEVTGWLESNDDDHIRTELFREIMRPAHTTHLWRDLKLDMDETLSGIKQIIAPGGREEAGVIALMMRNQLNQSGKTAALVTPDRMLARQVAGELARWDIKIDDSAGTPLFNSTPGIYLRLIAEMVGEKMAPITLMSALKHPLMSGGIETGAFRANVRNLERSHLRGPRPDSGLEGITALLMKAGNEKLLLWWENLSLLIEPFKALMEKDDVSFEDLLFEHITLAEKLAATDLSDGARILWKGDAGEAAAQLIEDLQVASPYLKNITADQYPSLFDQFMSNVTVRAKYGQHPRLHIWGPLEARLQHADLMILSGLNEGSWPPQITPDPWMSRPMRKEYGLPELEQKIGLSAHDFVQTASAKNVVITRAEKIDGTPTVKSRWLSRLHAVSGDLEDNKDSDQWLGWYNDLDKPAHKIEIKPPSPTPRLSSRPRDLSVTRIQMWMQDPYSLYANKILRLKALDELDQDPRALDKGIIIHNILEDFMSRYKDHLPQDAEKQILSIGEKYFTEVIDKPTVKAFWWPRFKQIAKWFINIERKRREYIKTVATETKGTLDINLPGGMFTLSATADRIDQFTDGSYSIIDYKTGSSPSIRQLMAGFAPQLPLEAVIAIKGGFSVLPAAVVSDLSYWEISGGENPGVIKDFNEKPAHYSRKMDVMKVSNDAYEGLVKLVTTFDILETPYLNNPRPKEMGYGEYNHLARSKEWGDD